MSYNADRGSSAGGSRGKNSGNLPIPKEAVYCYGFNQDASCLSVGTSRGYTIFNTHPFRPSFHESVGGIGLVEMLYCTSLLALVGAGDQEGFSPRCLKVWNTKRKASLFDLAFVAKIVGVKMNRHRLVVALEKSLYIFDLEKMEKMLDVETVENKQGLLALSAREDPSFLAFPSHDPGVVLLYDALCPRLLNQITAHKSKLAALAFALDGTLLATASQQGTVIRVFSVPAGDPLFTLRRGHSPCTIYSLAFNRAGSRLAASSDKGTVHVFHLPSSPSSTTSSPAPPPLRPPRSDQSKKSQDPASSSHQMPLSFRARGTSGGLFSGNFPSSLSTSSSELMTKFLPSNSLSETVEGIEGIRSFAQARVKEDWNRESGKWKRQVCALVPGRRGAGGEGEGAIKEGKETDEEFLIVLTAEGLFYRFELDVRRGGNCRLLDEKTLLQEEAASQAGAPRLLGGKTG